VVRADCALALRTLPLQQQQSFGPCLFLLVYDIVFECVILSMFGVCVCVCMCIFFFLVEYVIQKYSIYIY
jgi:hypothetical protein